MNQYIRLMEPPIRENGGFINKFIGDSVMALFPGRPDDAVQAALSMHEAITQYNVQLVSEGKDPLRIGIGINSGGLMLGTLGGQHIVWKQQ